MSNAIIGGKAETARLQHSRCIVSGCLGKSKWKPVLMVKPLGWRFMAKKVDPLLIPHEGFLCQEHRDLPRHIILNDEELTQIKAHLQDQNVAPPDWSTLKVGVVVVGDK